MIWRKRHLLRHIPVCAHLKVCHRSLHGFFRIAYNVFYDFMRSRKCSEEYSSDVLDQDYELPSETVIRNIDIYKAMQILKPEERAIIQLFYLEDLSLNKVSEIMNMPSGTVKSHLSRARQRLNVYLDKEDYKYGE